MPKSLPLNRLSQNYLLHLALFTNVKNAAHLHSQLLAKNTDYEYAFVDASILVSTNQPLAAAYRAIHDWIDPEVGLRTPNVHSETVFSFSPTHNITDSYRRFGISGTSTTILVIKILDSSADGYDEKTVFEKLTDIVEGEEIEFSNESIRKFTDVAKVKKYYKLKDLGLAQANAKKRGLEVAERTEEEQWGDLEAAVVGAMALRSLV